MNLANGVHALFAERSRCVADFLEFRPGNAKTARLSRFSVSHNNVFTTQLKFRGSTRP